MEGHVDSHASPTMSAAIGGGYLLSDPHQLLRSWWGLRLNSLRQLQGILSERDDGEILGRHLLHVIEDACRRERVDGSVHLFHGTYTAKIVPVRRQRPGARGGRF